MSCKNCTCKTTKKNVYLLIARELNGKYEKIVGAFTSKEAAENEILTSPAITQKVVNGHPYYVYDTDAVRFVIEAARRIDE